MLTPHEERMKAIFLGVGASVGLLAAVVLVDYVLAYSWLLFGDSLGVAIAVGCVGHIPWILKSKEPAFLIAIARVARLLGVSVSEKLMARYGFRLLGILLICGTAFLAVWLAEICFSVPLKVIDGGYHWFLSHAWSWGIAFAAVAAWLISNLVPTARAPVVRPKVDVNGGT
jgi:hypothetical protein